MIAEVSPVVPALVGVFRLILPEGVLLLAACVLFLGGTFRNNRHLWAGFALAALVAAGLALLVPLPKEPITPEMAYSAPLYLDPLRWRSRSLPWRAGAFSFCSAGTRCPTGWRPSTTPACWSSWRGFWRPVSPSA